MKKKLFAIILAIAMIFISSAYLSEVSFAQDAKYVISGDANVSFNTAKELLAYINNASDFASDKAYTLTLNDDLILPVEAGELKSLELSGNITINGNGKTISGADGGEEKTPLIRFSENSGNSIKLSLENLIIDGGVSEDNYYQGLNTLYGTSESELYINNTIFKNCLADEGGAAYIRSVNKFEIKNSKFTNNKARSTDGDNCIGGALNVEEGYNENFTCSIRNSEFINNSSNGDAGAINVYGKVALSNIKVIGNKARKYAGGVFLDNAGKSTLKDSFFENNEAGETGGAIAVRACVNTKLENLKILKNKATRGGGIFTEYCGTSIKNTEISGNHALISGGAFSTSGGYFESPLESVDIINNSADLIGGGMFLCSSNAEFKNCKLIGNKAGLNGGAIIINGWGVRYQDIENDTYDGLTTNENTIFDKNFAGNGFYNPPKNYKDFTNLKFAKYSLDGRLYVLSATNKLEKVDSLVNNYDVDYVNPKSITAYDPNGGQGKVYLSEVDSTKLGPDLVQEGSYGDSSFLVLERKSIIKTLEETGFTNSTKFIGWSTDKDATKSEYEPGQEINVKGNLYLYAIWEKPAPKPSTTLILTLDENHRSGEITNIEVEVGDLIEPHLYIPRRRGYIFRGWSYDQKHLDEVKPSDRIYTDTTLYAIWKRAEEEIVEEPEEIKGEDHKTYIFGYPNGTVRPNGSITRAEAAAMLARLLNIEAIGSAAKPNFTDTESSWYNKAINAVVFRGIMKGYPDGRFRSNAPITRAEFTQMISTIDNKPYGVAPFADVSGHWAERAIGSEYQAKRITGYPDGLFRPDANITRAEAAVILNKIFERKYDNLSLLKCKNPQMIKRFTDLDESFWGWNDMVEATNTHEFVRRYKEDLMKRLEEDWLLIK